MSKNLHNIENLFRNSLEDLTDSPSLRSWDNIEAQLDKEDAVNYKRKFSGLKKITAIVLFMLLGFIIYEAQFIQQAKLAATTKDSNHAGVMGKTDPPADNTTSSTAIENKEEPAANPALNNRTNTGIASFLIDDESARINRGIKDPQKKSNDQSVARQIIYATNNEGSVNNRQQYNAIELIPVAEQKMITGSSRALIVHYALPFPTPINQLALKKKILHLFSHYWTLTAVASSERSQYVLDNDVDDDNNITQEDQKTVIANRERHEPSFSAGILGTYRLKEKWALQTGLLFSQTQIAIDPQKIYANEYDGGDISYKYNSSSGYAFIKPGFGSSPAVGDSINATEAKHNLSYLSIPVILQYKWSKNKFTISPGFGFAINTLLNAKLETEVKNSQNRETVTINRLKGLRSMYAGIIANTDIQYNLGRNWSVNITPSFKYAVTSINKNNVVKTYPYSVGLGAGVSYRF